jgi:O-antigen/teichoic acid export membrane protein
MRALFSLAPVLAVRVGESGIRYGFNCALALSLGVAGAGQMYVGLSVLALLATLARFGLDQAAFRQVAMALGTGQRPAARGVALEIAGWALLAAGLLALLLALALPWAPPALQPVLLRLAPGLPALALLTIAGSLLAALGRPVAGQVVGAILWPGAVLLFLALGRASVEQVALATAAAMALAATSNRSG